MSLVVADRVKDVTTSVGTGTVTLSGSPPTGFQSFAAVGDGNTTYYTISGGSQWEVGIGTYTASGTTLSRNTVLSSSSAGALVDFAAGTKDVFVTLPSQRSYGIPFSTQSANYAASFNEGILANTSGGAFTVTLPASPVAGTQVIVADAANTWGTNNLTVARNGSTIEGTATDLTCDITGVSVQLIYSGTTWQVFAQAGGAGGSADINTQTTGTLLVSRGGTGATTLTGVVIGNATSAFTVKTNPTGAFVGTTDTQTLTNKTLTSYTETVFAVVDGATVNLDPNNGPIQTWTLGASRTPGQVNWAAGQSITLMIDDGTAYTVNWATLAVVWETNAGVAPTLATTGFTVIVLWKVGTTIYGARVGDA